MDIHQSKTGHARKTDAKLKETKAGQDQAKEEIMADLKTRIGCLASRIDVKKEKGQAWLIQN
jgi:antirestriction protein ArdC